MNKMLVKRLAALAVMVLGLLMAVLAPAGGSTDSWRIVGFALLAVGIIWMIKQPQKPQRQAGEEYERPPEMTLIQSPLLWVPIIIVVLGLLTWLLNG
ncbi:MAG: hypothetical protein WEA82_00730 [Idiomarina sp.]